MLVCKKCSKEFVHKTNYKKVFCSDRCFRNSKKISGKDNHNWKGRKQKFTCINCNIEFESYFRSKGIKPKYCSSRCSGIHTARKGEKNNKWKGGITPINSKIRHSIEYKLWRDAVFKRDNYQCIWGGKEHGNKLNADHIKPFSLFPELRFAIDNGRTLCIECHKKTDTYGKQLKI